MTFSDVYNQVNILDQGLVMKSRLAPRKRQEMICCLSLFLALSGLAASQAREAKTLKPVDAPSGRSAGISELARDNYNHVAASASDIKAVLSRDPGLMVELKRLIAKEASDTGQFVNDEDLTDQAVSDRLNADVKFRALVTRLVQRYGYLLPTLNPDSDAGKQQDLVLKERARRLVQIEAQEDSASLQPKSTDNTPQTTSACEQSDTSDCDTRSSDHMQQNIPSQLPPANPLPRGGAQPEIPEQRVPMNGPSQLLRTDNDSPDFQGLMGGMGASSGNSGAPALMGGGLSGNSLGTGQINMAALSQEQGASLLEMANRGRMSDSIQEMPSSSFRPGDLQSGALRDARPRLPAKKELPPVTMVHSPSPYSDIPSLYDLYVQAASRDLPPQRFGAETFRDGLRDPRAIPMDLPVGPDYVVGPGDSLSIDLWGGMSMRLVRTVDREGRLLLPEAGPLQVSGRSLGEVQQAVEHAVGTQFRDTSADVSVSRLRTVRVYIVGEVREPGAYDISSLSTALNALVAAGGVTTRGSLRQLKHYRGRQLLEDIDVYDLLLHGVTPDAKKLENGDTLMVPSIGPQVTITGMVRRPAVYELNVEKSLVDALELAGGILPAAALKHVEVQRVEAHEKRSMLSLDLTADNGSSPQLTSFNIQDGDEIHIFPIAPYNQDTIYLQGHVLRPGRYSFQNGMKLTDLISSYKDLLPEPAAHYAEIVRLNPPDFHPSVQSFDLASALTNPAAAPKLEPLDTVRIFSRFDFEPAPEVWVGGEVRAPGKYVTSGQAHLRDAVFIAGGLAPDASLDTVQLFRMEADGNTKILSVNLGQALAGDPVQNILLQPRDRLIVHRNAEQVDPSVVSIKGEVAKPGRYPMSGNMHVEDLIRVAGGFKRSADISDGDLTRYSSQSQTGEHLRISLASVLNGNSIENIPLRNGDVLTIRQVPGWNDIGATASMRGEVVHPGSYGIQPGERLSSVLLRAGGYTGEAYSYGAVLMRTAVREVEEKSRQELVRRVEAQQANIRALPDADVKASALAQTQATLDQLRSSPPIGRLVIHVNGPIEKWKNTQADTVMRDGDVLMIPKKADYVMVNGQVYNPTAVSYRGGRSANWYLGQAGGLTQLADKKGVFVIRADGSVISAKNQSGLWGGDPLNASLRPGDTVVVPEKALNVGNKNWTTLLQTAQVAASIALTVTAIHP